MGQRVSPASAHKHLSQKAASPWDHSHSGRYRDPFAKRLQQALQGLELHPAGKSGPLWLLVMGCPSLTDGCCCSQALWCRNTFLESPAGGNLGLPCQEKDVCSFEKRGVLCLILSSHSTLQQSTEVLPPWSPGKAGSVSNHSFPAHFSMSELAGEQPT